MRTFWQPVRRFLLAEQGPTAVEYAVMLALIIMACLAAVMLVGQNTLESFEDSRDRIQSAMDAGG